MKGPLSRAEIADRLRELGAYMRLRGDNPWRARAYDSAAAAVDALGARFDELLSEGRLTEAPGIGPKLAGVIAELAETGTAVRLEELRGELPPGLLPLARLRGLTLPRLRALHATLGVDDLEGLRRAVEDGSLRTVRGFGPATHKVIAEAVARADEGVGQFAIGQARPAALALLQQLEELPGVTSVVLAGDLRRWAEVTQLAELVVEAARPEPALEAIVSRFGAQRVENRHGHTLRLRLMMGLPAEIEVVAPAGFAAALLRRTGSAAHLARLEALATARGTTLAGLAGADEGALYAALGLPEIPPELREDAGEIEAAQDGDDFHDLVRRQDVRGFVHCHTTYSDGRNTVEEMARAAQRLGLEYLTITDHSPTASYAGGVPPDRLPDQWQEIAAAQELVKLRLLRGTESDILRDGALDYAPSLLAQLQIVIASVHDRMRMDDATMTDRLVQAMRQPAFKIWGHPLGRLILRREPIACRVEEVLDAAAAGRAAIELNGDPRRLDLPAEWVRAARARGLRFVISVDAHSTKDLEHLPYGVALARRGGVRRAEVLNTLGADDFAAAVRPL